MVINLAGLTSMDSADVGMLITCGGEMEEAGGTLRIAGAVGAVAKTFEVVHMSRIVALDADIEAACRNLSGNLSAEA